MGGVGVVKVEGGGWDGLGFAVVGLEDELNVWVVMSFGLGLTLIYMSR